MPVSRTKNETQMSEEKKEHPQSGSNLLIKTPAAVVRTGVLSFLDSTNLLNFAKTSKASENLAQSTINFQKLLDCVAKGKQDEAYAILSKNPELLFKKGMLTDYSKRTFKNISAFEYALWAYDSKMWKMMLPMIDKIPNGYEMAAQQLDEVENGIEYTIQRLVITNKEDEKKEHKEIIETKKDSHYDFKLIEVLDAHSKYYDDTKFNPKEANRRWREVVGGEQRLVPAHVANAYCTTKGEFNEKTNFQENSPRTLKLQIPKEATFFPLHSNNGVGVDCAVYNDNHGARGVIGLGPGKMLTSNYLAIKELYAVSTKEYSKLKDHITESIHNNKVTLPLNRKP